MKIIKIPLLALGLMLISIMSCKERLTETIYSEVLADTAYETEEDAAVLILGVYAGLKGWSQGFGSYYKHNYIQLSELPTDYGQDTWSSGTDPYETGTWDSNQQFTLDLWASAYVVIDGANFAIATLEGMDIEADVKAGFIAEAKFLRALAYYDLTFNFKDVVLKLGEPGNFPLSPQAEVIAQILTDLTDAIAVLPSSDVYNGVGRATKGAALALRAKTNLNAKNWAEAAADAQEVIDLGEYDLMPSGQLLSLYDVSNRSDNEWIFAVQSETGTAGATTTLSWFGLDGSYQRGGWGNLTVSVDFYNSFELNDERRTLMANGYQDGTMRTGDDGDWYFAAPNTPEHDSLATVSGIDLRDNPSVPFIKYSGGHDRFAAHLGGGTGVNYMILRYADILLVAAEGLNETGNQGGAMALVNEVRSRAGLADLVGLSQAALRDAILEERGKELFMEGSRRLDLIRSGKYIELWRAGLEAKYPGSNFDYLDDSKIYFPIPQVEVDANDQINGG
ncbi:MAG: RagB/SusD family nutrient uptake outer membrane protein [Cyclobacteriaceae bacterium]|nr:RagB/SusD family nutrient uptake outer membrane protein [Cyclobacteriaceae bacterium]